jgi:hypothetical protein
MPPLHRYLGDPSFPWRSRPLLSRLITTSIAACALRRDRIQGLHLRTNGMEFASEMVVRSSLRQLNHGGTTTLRRTALPSATPARLA